MRFFGAIALAVAGSLTIGFCRMIPFWESTVPTDLVVHHVAEKPLIPAVDPPASVSSDETATSSDVLTPVDPSIEVVNSSEVSKLCYKIALLDRGVKFLQGVTDYTAKMRKQELVHNQLLDEQTMLLKCRHYPFSVYLLWLTGDVGREVLYKDGENQGRMVAHDGGWKAKIPALTLSTDGMLAMRDARYPVTTAGMLGLIKIMLDVHHHDLARLNFASCEIDPNGQFDGRPCEVFTTKYKSSHDSPVYRKSVTWIDREWSIPLHTMHFEWPKAKAGSSEKELDETTLIESYSFTEVQLHCHLSDHDFDRSNQEYHFR